MSDAFLREVNKEFKNQLSKGYKGLNKDIYRFPENLKKNRFVDYLKMTFSKLGIREKTKNHFEQRLSNLKKHNGEGFSYLFNLLEDEYSKNSLVNVFLYRVLGDYFRFPNESEYIKNLKLAELNVHGDNYKEIEIKGSALRLYSYDTLDHSQKLYLPVLSYCHNFLCRQYCYEVNEVTIKPQKNQVIVDGGGFIGDTTLFFLEETQSLSKIETFEFVQGNLDVLYKLLKMYGSSEQVRVIEHPLWNCSDIEIKYKDNANSTSIAMGSKGAEDKSVQTESIDNAFKNEDIDFIKLDIEGAELEALKGAEQVLRRCKPDLAVCLYHKITDYYTIPRYLNELNIGYKFYFKHVTIHHEESVLFATAK